MSHVHLCSKVARLNYNCFVNLGFERQTLKHSDFGCDFLMIQKAPERRTGEESGNRITQKKKRCVTLNFVGACIRMFSYTCGLNV
jgi:hypothetical protein